MKRVNHGFSIGIFIANVDQMESYHQQDEYGLKKIQFIHALSASCYLILALQSRLARTFSIHLKKNNQRFLSDNRLGKPTNSK